MGCGQQQILTSLGAPLAQVCADHRSGQRVATRFETCPTAHLLDASYQLRIVILQRRAFLRHNAAVGGRGAIEAPSLPRTEEEHQTVQ